MKDWKLPEAQRCLDEIVRRAKGCGPRGVMESEGDAVVGRAHDHERFATGFTFPDEDQEPGGEPASLVEFMQTSPLADAVRAGEWPWEWDDATRSWVLPGNAVPA